MATKLVMPQMGYDMKEGKLVRWLKKEGDTVSRGESVAEIETDKAVVEMEAYASGVLRKIVVGEGATVAVGGLIGVVGEPAEDIGALLQEAPAVQAPVEAAPASRGAPTPEAPAGEVRASPLARRLAQEKGIDLTQVKGTGPGGRITQEDVLAVEAPTKAAPAAPVTLPIESAAGRIQLSRMRQAIARRTSQSKREAPHFYISADVDMSAAQEVRRQLNEELGERAHISVNDMVVKAAAKALQKFPVFNASYKGEYLELNPDVNIGIAIALEGQGLIVPAIANCEKKSLVEIAQASKDLVQRAQKGVLKPEEYAGGTFSISNLGMYDVDTFTAIILPPQSAVLAVGAIRKQPVVRDNAIVVAQVMRATLSVDHRVADGAQAAQFMGEIKRLLELPVSILV